MINPIIVSAPLKVNELNANDIENIYIFDYSKSFNGCENKPQRFMNYIETLGCMCDVIIDSASYEDKESIILEYFNSGTFYNIYTLTSTMISILLYKKNISYSGISIFNENETKVFIDKNKNFVNKLIEIFDSLFLIMLLYSYNPCNNMDTIKNKYPSDKIDKKEYSPNICNLLLNKEFYIYYDEHISEDVKYYEFLFDKTLYRGKTFINILTSTENVLLNILLDIHNPKFKKYVLEKGS